MNNETTFTEQEVMMVDFALTYCANAGIFSAEADEKIIAILDKMKALSTPSAEIADILAQMKAMQDSSTDMAGK